MKLVITEEHIKKAVRKRAMAAKGTLGSASWTWAEQCPAARAWHDLGFLHTIVLTKVSYCRTGPRGRLHEFPHPPALQRAIDHLDQGYTMAPAEYELEEVVI